ncbi:N-acyl homoserine lactonase family protein [Clostridium sp. DJ247]|uniref:N-acyl homoserine lactonase family protein n=1 Tax=Clostridium sp. DJ247 TaxID=2726188 RepID=UPI0016282731|nr:N-acyl homoserine lactonase family protein [Clostridium sp. DJ247]MBC2582176.1 N-acyl homoserine lactonase family protein [Clostridium sp. DJ247]
MKVYILNTGWLECDKNSMVAMSTVGTRSNPNVKSEWIKIPVIAVLIDHSDGKILYDLGCNPKAMEGYWPDGLKEIFPFYKKDNQDLVKQLELCNTKPEEINTIILSHMHLDHAGNLELFKHADVYVHKKDFEYGQTLIHLNPDPAKHGAYIKQDLEVPVKQYYLVEEDFEIMEGIEVITLPGHTPGILGLVVHLEKDGTLIFPQDCVYTAENYGPPAKASGLVYDSIAFFNSIEKVRKLEKKHNAKVIFAHDMTFFETLRHAPQYYE